MQHVFVYGTLRAGEANDIHRAASRNGIAPPVLVGIGHVRGRLFDFGAFPGLVLDAEADDATVRGDIYAIDDALVPVLDEIEEVVPGVEGVFRSERIDVTVSVNGREQTVYCLIYPVGENAVTDLKRIEEGDWIEYGRHRGNRGD